MRRASTRRSPAAPSRRASARPRPAAAGGGDARRRLDEAEARYRALTGMLPLVAYVAALDVQGAFLQISPQVEGLLGFAPEAWTSDPRLWLSRVHPDDRARVLSLLVGAHRGGRPFAAEYRLLARDGRPRWVRDESRAVRDAAGRPLFIVGTWTEITERKRLERETAGRGRELASSRQELAELVSVASHEMAAPLRRIVNLGDMLGRRARLDEPSRALLGRMMDSAARLQELVAGLVRYAEQDAAAPAALSAVDVGRALDQALEELGEAAARAGAAVTRGPLPRVWAEPALLRRVLRNLLDNAFKFRGRARARVHVSAERAGREWVVSVRDHGVGFDPRLLPRVFSLLDRVEARGPGAGLGLGLAVCRKLVERLGGRIWAQSEPGEGAVVRFALPAADEEGAA